MMNHNGTDRCAIICFNNKTPSMLPEHNFVSFEPLRLIALTLKSIIAAISNSEPYVRISPSESANWALRGMDPRSLWNRIDTVMHRVQAAFDINFNVIIMNEPCIHRRRLHQYRHFGTYNKTLVSSKGNLSALSTFHIVGSWWWLLPILQANIVPTGSYITFL